MTFAVRALHPVLSTLRVSKAFIWFFQSNTAPVNQSRLLISHWPISNQYRHYRAERSGSEKRPPFSFDKAL